MSTKLIHGGLRYLEHYEFRLVRESLIEREILWQMAPHIIEPIRFVLPHHRALRPAWLIRLGLYMYDHIGGRKRLPPSHGLDLAIDPAGQPLNKKFRRGFEYSDCRVDDARLVILNAMDARARGADIYTRTKMRSAKRGATIWQLDLTNQRSGDTHTHSARVLINAGGPWVTRNTNQLTDAETGMPLARRSGVHLVKGSHIVVPKLFDDPRAYIFQNTDERIVFAIPYQRYYTLIGTTDVDYDDDPAKVSISSDEVQYLCQAISSYFIHQVKPSDVVWSYAGLRPLFDEGEVSAKERTRDYVLELDAPEDRPPLLTVFGGKITTYRHLAEDVFDKLSHHIAPTNGRWTKGAALPGGDFPVNGRPALQRELQDQCQGLDDKLAARLTQAYGTLAKKVIGGASSTADLGQHFGSGLYQREIEYLMVNEWAASAEDILWRRSKLGLRFSADQTTALENWIAAHLAEVKPSPQV